ALPAVDLEQHAPDIATFGDAVATTAMGAADVIRVAQVHARTDGNGFLPDVEMDESGHGAGSILATHAVVELAYRAHAAVGIQQSRWSECHFLGSGQRGPSSSCGVR